MDGLIGNFSPLINLHLRCSRVSFGLAGSSEADVLLGSILFRDTMSSPISIEIMSSLGS